jgi:O-acetyl-ADP-ribose deacetylase (regulator of RNase III)
MTIEFVKGNIFESGCEALVCPTNCVGVMGKGLALQFKKRYPGYYTDYRWRCDNGYMKIGRVDVWAIGFFLVPPEEIPGMKFIFSFPTKLHWRDKSELPFIESGLEDLIRLLTRKPYVRSVAVPALGAGLGGLAWSDVKPLMVEAARRLPDVLWRVYEPLEGE